MKKTQRREAAHSSKNTSPQRPFRKLFISAGVATVFLISFLLTHETNNVSSSELSYIEYSPAGVEEGSVVPASCDSATPFNSPTSQGGTAGSHFPGDCTTLCPQGGGSYDPYYDPAATACPTVSYRICPASATTPGGGSTVQLHAYHKASAFDCSNLTGTTNVTGSVTWSSSAPAVATVGNGATAGLVTGVSTVWSWTSISTSTYLGLTAPAATVTVLGTPANFRVCPAGTTIGSGTTLQLRAFYRLGGVDCANTGLATDVTSSVTWSSLNSTIATVGNGAVAGLLTGITTGFTSLNLSQYLGQTAPSVPVQVTGSSAYRICPGSAIVTASGFPFRAYHNPSGVVNCANTAGATDVTGSVTWLSSNSGVATVGNGGSAGIVTAVSAGSSNISTTPYLGLISPTALASVACIPSVSCSSAGPTATAANKCAGETFPINDGCGGLITCNGARVCDFNWKEVSQ